MAALKTIKTKIRSYEKSRQVTKAMEAVSAAKMRKAQVRAITGRPYAFAAVEILRSVSGAKNLLTHPLFIKRPIQKALYIVITSDKGLAGALNSAVLRSVWSDMQVLQAQSSVIAVGRKANEFFQARAISIEAYHPHTAVVDEQLITTIVREAADQFSTGGYDVVKIAYQNFVSTFEQRPIIHTMFPLSLAELQKLVADITPTKGKFSNIQEEQTPSFYNIEPSQDEVLAQVLPRLAGIFVYHALLEAEASEHSARMVAMKSASDKAGELTDKLRLQFNKARQAAITREVSEITGGMEAVAV